MIKSIKKAFTISELVVVVAILGLLMMGMTVYLGGAGDRANTIEAQGCGMALRGEVNNYVFYALTSRNIRLTGDNKVSPDYYYIQLSGGTSSSTKNCTVNAYNGTDGTFCDKIVVGLTTGNNTDIVDYESYTPKNTCRQEKFKIGFYWSGGTTSDIKYIKMNKGFAPTSISERKVFYLQQNGSNDSDKLLEGSIIVVLCMNDECSSGKEIVRLYADARSQTVSYQKCAFYIDDALSKCGSRVD